MAYWRKKLRQAAFRGIRFNLTEAENNFGRRTANHEFPKRDEPYSEDLGRKAAEYSFDAYVNGFEYFRQRDRLIDACNKSGPGKLVHPYLGTKQVVCTGCDVRESATEGGLAHFRLTFREAGSLKFPQSSQQPKGLLGLLGLDLADKAVTEFTDNLNIAEKPQWVVDQVEGAVTDFADALETSTSFITRNSDAIADLASSIDDLKADLQGLLLAPATLADRMKNAMSLLKDSILDSNESFEAYKRMKSFSSSQQKSTKQTVLRGISNKNIDAVNNFTRQLAIANGAQVITDIAFDSVESAVNSRQALFDGIEDQEAVIDLSDDIYQSLQQMRAELKKAVPQTDQALPDVIDVTTIATTNSIILCYNLYGTLEKEQDIVDRNKIVNPGFIPGGEKIKVLFNG